MAQEVRVPAAVLPRWVTRDPSLEPTGREEREGENGLLRKLSSDFHKVRLSAYSHTK